jgi:hypothetical protein
MICTMRLDHSNAAELTPQRHKARVTEASTFLFDISDEVEPLSSTAISRRSIDALEVDVKDLPALQSSIRNTYKVAPTSDGQFAVLFPNGGKIGTYASEEWAQRMARALEAGKASMIHAAHFKVERTDAVINVLRNEGFSDAQIDAAFIDQSVHQFKAADTLRSMIEHEILTAPSLDQRETALSHYRVILPTRVITDFLEDYNFTRALSRRG